MANLEVQLNLDDAVAEVLNSLTGLDLEYSPEFDRYQSIARTINRALRDVALEAEWACYTTTEDVGPVVPGERTVFLRPSVRPRINADDAVRLVYQGRPVEWAYFLPRDSLSKYDAKGGLRVAIIRNELHFSRPFLEAEAGWGIEVPVQREPRMFQIPNQPDDPYANRIPVPPEVREQLVDFDYPDLIVARATYLYAQTDPLMQPRVQTLEAIYKDRMYALSARNNQHNDSPYVNPTILPMQGDLYSYPAGAHRHPHASGW